MPTGDAPTTSEWATIQLPTKVRLILETWRYFNDLMQIYNISWATILEMLQTCCKPYIYGTESTDVIFIDEAVRLHFRNHKRGSEAQKLQGMCPDHRWQGKNRQKQDMDSSLERGEKYIVSCGITRPGSPILCVIGLGHLGLRLPSEKTC